MATTTVNQNPTGTRNTNNPAWDVRKRNYIYWTVAVFAVLAAIAALTFYNREAVAPVAPTTIAEPTLPQNAAPGSMIERRTEKTTTTTK